MRLLLQDAYVLHRGRYSESSLLLKAFTREQGVVALIAKGALRGKGDSGLLQPFTPLSISFSAKGGLGALSGVESRGPSHALGGKLLFCGFYLNELLLRLLAEHDPHPDLFEYYQTALSNLEQSDSMEQTLRLFELALLGEIGYGLDLARDAADGQPIRAEEHYLYQAEIGFVSAPAGGAAIAGETLLELCSGRLSTPRARQEAKRLTRRLLRPHLGDKPLKSRELFKYTPTQSN